MQEQNVKAGGLCAVFNASSALVCTQHEYEDSFVTDKYITSDPVPRTNPDCIPLTLSTD